ncbi:MAG: hypothetical protein HC898_09570 [Phycisphaerales bacterium]|nr:hypothetical protein [Phycisphaerales bacterium]
MAKTTAPAKPGTEAAPAAGPPSAPVQGNTTVMTAADVTAPPTWGQLWQLPVLLLGFVLLGAGLYLS